MDAIQINHELTAIHFPPNDGNSNPFTSYVLKKGSTAILIDSCAFHNSVELHQYLERMDLNPSAIIFSHYHGDHIGGYSTFPEIEIRIGSSRYNEMLSLYSKLDNSEKYIPTHTVNEAGLDIKIGDFNLHLFQTSGHSPCSISTVIDNKFLHLGDVFINTENAEPLLPLAYYELQSEHFISLEKIEQYIDLFWLPGHGRIKQDAVYKAILIADQRKYFGSIQTASGSIDYKEATKELNFNYGHEFWHERNLKEEE